MQKPYLEPNQPAWPQSQIGAAPSTRGMTVRDYIALEILKNLILVENDTDTNMQQLTETSFEMADDFISTRNRGIQPARRRESQE
jgi:hypothetical protein